MIKNFFVLSLFILICSSIFTSCEKAPDIDSKLPDITSIGKGTFGARVNGTVWLPCCGALGQPTSTADQSVYGFIWIGADEKNSGIRVVVNDASGIQANKVYTLSNSPDVYSEYYTGDDSHTCFYDRQHTIDGKIVFSKVGEIVSGTFEFRMLNPQCSGDTIRVTDGRFDLR